MGSCFIMRKLVGGGPGGGGEVGFPAPGLIPLVPQDHFCWVGLNPRPYCLNSLNVSRNFAEALLSSLTPNNKHIPSLSIIRIVVELNGLTVARSTTVTRSRFHINISVGSKAIRSSVILNDISASVSFGPNVITRSIRPEVSICSAACM